MSFYNILPEIRPNRMVPKSQKDLDYHRRMGRWAIGSANTNMINATHEKMRIAERAYNDKVLTQEDIDTFLRDENNNARNRVMFSFNMVKPIVDQNRGVLIQTRFNATMQPVSRRVITRRQKALAKKLIMFDLAQTSADMKRIVSKRYQLGESVEEIVGMHTNLFQDKYFEAGNHLLAAMAAINKSGEMRGDDALRFSLSGVLPEICRVNGSHLRWERIHPRNFFWDTDAEQLDFSDADFLGVCPLKGLGELAELYNLDREYLSYIEDAIRMYNGFTGMYGANNNAMPANGTSKVRAFSIFWDDLSYREFGYINGDGGVPTLVTVGEPEDGYGKKVYTKNDLIDPPDTEQIQKLFNGKRTRKSTVQCTRFVDMVPWEYLVGGVKPTMGEKPDQLPDLVLDHGVYELQGYNPYDPSESLKPIKAVAYAMADGEIISPVQAAIDPGRYANRVLSTLESQMNMAGAKGGTIDMDMVDPDMPITEVSRRRKAGEMIPLRANGRGAGNALGNYDDTPGQGTISLIQIVSYIEGMMRTVTGHSAAMAGEDPVKGQGLGLTELLVKRGMLMHEPFHDLYQLLQLNKARFNATAGKEFYLQRPDVLMDMITDENMRALILSEEFSYERFNGQVVRDNPEDDKRAQANNWLDMLLQLGVIDKKIYMDLYNNSHVEDVAPAVKQYLAQLEIAEAEAAKAAKQEEIMAGLQAQDQELQRQEEEAQNQKQGAADELAKVRAKTQGDILKEEVKAAVAPKPAPGPATTAATKAPKAPAKKA